MHITTVITVDTAPAHVTLTQAAGKLGEEWRPLLLRLAEETVSTVVPQPRDDEMDLRAYVKVNICLFQKNV